MTDFLKPDEIAAEWRVSKTTVYRLINTGEIESVRIGRSFRVSRAALDDYLRRVTGVATVDGGRG